MSTLLTTTTIFLPHARTRSRKRPLALGEGAVGGGGEEHQVGARHEAVGDRLVASIEGVGAGCVDEGEVREQRQRRRSLLQPLLERAPSVGVAVAEQVDAGGRRRHSLLEHGAAEEGVDEGALAGVELADDDEQEELVELTDRLGERRAVVGLGLDASEGNLQLGKGAAFLDEQSFLVVAEQAGRHGRILAPGAFRLVAHGREA
jgi:hypothetical protein